MKSYITFGILLIAIGTYLIVPVVPIFDYLINKDYIAKNLCVNKDKPKSCCKGKCHLIKQLNKANSQQENEKKELPKRLQFKQLQDFIICKGYESLIPDHASLILFSWFFRKSELHPDKVYIPPEV